jgi:hypothetical protein
MPTKDKQPVANSKKTKKVVKLSPKSPKKYKKTEKPKQLKPIKIAKQKGCCKITKLPDIDPYNILYDKQPPVLLNQHNRPLPPVPNEVRPPPRGVRNQYPLYANALPYQYPINQNPMQGYPVAQYRPPAQYQPAAQYRPGTPYRPGGPMYNMGGNKSHKYIRNIL